VAFALAALLGLARAGRRAAAAACALGIALGAASYPLWGCLWDQDLYGRVQAAMASAPLRLDNFLALIANGSLVDRDFGAGYMLFLWIAFALPAPRAADPLKLAAAAYTALVALTTWFPFGWYRIPLFPLLAVLAGHALARLAARPRLPAAFLLAATIVVPSFAYRSPLPDGLARYAVAGALAALLAPIALASFAGLPRLVPRAASIALIALALALQVAVSLHLPYIDGGLVKDRKPSYVTLADGTKVRWR
jgi:hypothetical protein